MHDLVLGANDLEELEKPLKAIRNLEGVLSVLLINRSGRLLARIGEVSDFQAQTLGALIAGSFSSIITILDVISDPGSPALAIKARKKIRISLPSGNRNIHISLADDSTFLAAIFENECDIHEVRSRINACGQQLAGILKTFYAKMEAGPEVNLDLGEPTWNV
jgi:hypothetical protein